MKPLLNSFRVLAELQLYIMRVPVWSVLGGTYCWRRKVPGPLNNPFEPNDEARRHRGILKSFQWRQKADTRQQSEAKKTCSSICLIFQNTVRIICF